MITLAGRSIRSLSLSMPYTGVASADIELVDPVALPLGRASLVVGDLTLQGTITDGGRVGGEGRYSWLAGAGGWRKDIAPRGEGASQVRISTVLKAVAEAAGETIVIGVADVPIGIPGSGGYARFAGPAYDVFNLLKIPWYVDASGLTQIAARPAGVAPTTGTLAEVRQEDNIFVVEPPDLKIAGYLPGRTYLGKQIALLQIDAHEGSPLRLTLYLREADDLSHALRAQLDRLVEQQTPQARYFGRYRYRLRSRNGQLYGAEPVDPSMGLPKLDNRQLWFGLPGCEAIPLPDTTDTLPAGADPQAVVIVSFLDGDPAHAVIDGFMRDAMGRRPQEVSIDAKRVNVGAATKLVARDTDDVGCGDLKVTTLAGALIIQLLDEGNMVTKTWSITGSNGAGPVTFVTVASPLGDSGAIDGKILTPSQDRVYA